MTSVHVAGVDPGLAVVTGASSGLGAEIARQLSGGGHPVLAVARRADRLEALAAAARAAGGAPVHPLPLDVTAPGAAATLRDRARQLGGAAWLVNDAGSIHVGRLDESDPAELAALVRLNCESLVTILATMLPDMIAAGRGVVLNVSSLAGMNPTPFWATYGASKAFIITLTEGVAEELRGTGVTITAFCPGPMTTELFAKVESGAGRRRQPHELSPEAAARSALRAARRGRVVVVPGIINQVLAWSSALSPRALVRRVASRTTLGYVGLPQLGPRRPSPRLTADG